MTSDPSRSRRAPRSSRLPGSRASPPRESGSRPRRAGSRADRATDAPPPSRQAAHHQRTRRAHSSEIAEDYVETIATLLDRDGEARVVDVARCLGVTHVTVVRTIARLQRDGLVTSRPYRGIFLTDAGRSLAERSRRRHETVVRLLLALGVSRAAAEADAEGIEHHVGPETLAAFERFVQRESR